MTSAFMRALAAGLLPTLQAIANIMVEAKEKGSAFGAVIDGIVVVVKTAASAVLLLSNAVSSVVTYLAAGAAQVVALMTGNWRGAIEIGKQANADFVASWASTGERIQRIWTASTETVAVATENNIGKRVRAPLVAVQQDVKKLEDVFGNLKASLEKELAGLAEYSTLQKTLIELGKQKYDVLNQAQRDELLAIAKSIDATKLLKDQMKELIKVEAEAWKLEEQRLETATKSLGEFQKVNDAMEFENNLIGVTNVQRERALALRDKEQAVLRAASAEEVEIIERLYHERLKLIDTHDARSAEFEGWRELFADVGQLSQNFFTDFFEHGSQAFRHLWEDFKHWALEALAKVAAQRIVVAIGASLGGTAASAAGSAASSAGPNLFGNAVGSTLSNSLFGSAGIGGLFSGAGGIFGSGAIGNSLALSGIGQSLGLSAVGLDAAGGVGLTALGTTLGAAIPVIGAALAIAAMFGAFKSGGGPKTGGFAASEGVNVDRFFTPNQADSELGGVVGQLGTDYATIARALGASGNASFALGFDTDPNGSAGSRVSSGAFVNGAQVYGARDVDVGRNDADLQARLSLEAKRVLFAALQASDLPSYLADLFQGIDAASATAEQIDNIVRTAEALKLAVDTVGQLGPAFEKLSGEDIKALLEAFGGIDAFARSFQFLNDNFLTDADRHAAAVRALTQGFAELGVAVPASHQDFLDLVHGLDLSTESGRALYASLMNLAPLFVEVNGTAQDAANGLNQLTEAGRALVESARALFNDRFYSDQEKQARAVGAAWQQIHAAERAIGGDVAISIPSSIAGFRSLIESIDTTTEAGRALYNALIVLAPAVLTINQATEQVVDTAKELQHVVDAGSIIGQGLAQAAQILQQVDSVVSASGGDVGSKLALKVSVLGHQIVQVQDTLANLPWYQDAGPLQTALAKLQQENSKATAYLAQYTTLTARYDAARAGQLIALQQQYDQQRDALRGNAAALADANTVFQQRWNEIVNGVTTGVDKTLDALTKLRQGLRDYLRQFTIGSGSILDPLSRAREAQAFYRADVTKAGAGDLDAYGRLTKDADAYYQIFREVYASSQNTVDAFNEITRDFTRLGAAGGPADASQALAEALPTDSKLASSNDIAALRETVAVLLARIDANTDATAASVNQNTRAVYDTAAPNRK
jgi:hypothetical protein